MFEKSSKSQIAEMITSQRQRKNLTQQKFAELLKTSQSVVARMESGKIDFSVELLEKIEKVLGKKIFSLSGDSINLKIEGGHKLAGSITTNTSKNAAMSALCASLLNRGKTTLLSLPKIEEVFRMLEVFESIGVRTKWKGSDLEIKAPEKFLIENINSEAAKKTRSVLMTIGALVHFSKNFYIPLAGGCKLGERTIRPHLFALEKFGVSIETGEGRYHIKNSRLSAAEIVMYEMGDTATENALIAASLTPGKTVIHLASANYMVQDLCFLLQKFGVKIEGVGTPTLKVQGVKQIKKNIRFAIGEDPIESMLFLGIAATTGSQITIKRCPIDFLRQELFKLEKMGMKFSISKIYKSENGFTNLVDIKTFESSLKALPEKIHPLPSNMGINIDNLPFFVPIATQCEGKTLIHDWTYENRSIYFLELTKLRAGVTLLDPHRVQIEGKTELKAAEVVCPPALRPAVIVLIAMLAAKGTSVLRNIYSIARGYENLAERLKNLGAKIEVI